MAIHMHFKSFQVNTLDKAIGVDQKRIDLHGLIYIAGMLIACRDLAIIFKILVLLNIFPV